MYVNKLLLKKEWTPEELGKTFFYIIAVKEDEKNNYDEIKIDKLSKFVVEKINNLDADDKKPIDNYLNILGWLNHNKLKMKLDLAIAINAVTALVNALMECNLCHSHKIMIDRLPLTMTEKQYNKKKEKAIKKELLKLKPLKYYEFLEFGRKVYLKALKDKPTASNPLKEYTPKKREKKITAETDIIKDEVARALTADYLETLREIGAGFAMAYEDIIYKLESKLYEDDYIYTMNCFNIQDNLLTDKEIFKKEVAIVKKSAPTLKNSFLDKFLVTNLINDDAVLKHFKEQREAIEETLKYLARYNALIDSLASKIDIKETVNFKPANSTSDLLERLEGFNIIRKLVIDKMKTKKELKLFSEIFEEMIETAEAETADIKAEIEKASTLDSNDLERILKH